MKLRINVTNKAERFKEAREHKFNEPFEWNTKLFQANFESQFHIAAKALTILKAQLNGGPMPNLVWRTVDNTFYQFSSADEFLDFATAVDTYVEQLLFESWQHIDG